MRRQPDAEGQRLHAVIDRQVQHLVRMVDDLLDVSRVLRGKVELRREPLDIADAIAMAVETSRPLIDAQRQELVVRLPGRPVTVHGDPVRLAQVIANLLNNASKYSARRRGHPPRGPAGRRRGGDRGARRRRRHSRRPAAARVRAVRAGRPVARTIAGRARHRPHAGEEDRRPAPRPGVGAERGCRPRQRVRDSSAGHGRGRARRRAARPGGRRARVSGARSWSWTTTWMPPRASRCSLQTDGHIVTMAHNGMDAVQRVESWRPGRRRARRGPARHERLRGGAGAAARGTSVRSSSR